MARNVQCLEISAGDIGAIADLLARGFPGRPRDYWMQGLIRQSEREVPEGYPRYGYVLKHEDKPVGVLLVLFTATYFKDIREVRCNVASWYVDTPFRGHAPRLVKTAMRFKDVTYLNVTPAISTWPLVEKLGFSRYCNGLFFSLPALSKAARNAAIEVVGADSAAIDGLSEGELKLLKHHASYGCLSAVVRRPDGGASPFILTPYRVRHGTIALPAMQMIFCRGVDDYVRCAGAVGKMLLRRGKPIVAIDANGPLHGLVGYYTEARGRKYFRGPNLPSLADLAETELVLYGI
jgi:hypothetical protein